MSHPLIDAIYTKLFYRDGYFFLFLSGALALHILIWGALIVFFDTFRPIDTDYIALHYSIVIGADFIARWESIFLVPGIGAFLILCNTLLGRAMMHTNMNLARALALAALVGNGVLVYVLFLLYRINV